MGSAFPAQPRFAFQRIRDACRAATPTPVVRGSVSAQSIDNEHESTAWRQMPFGGDEILSHLLTSNKPNEPISRLTARSDRLRQKYRGVRDISLHYVSEHARISAMFALLRSP
ncbi:unnamed protein product [Leptosia nina]|uniref:Uncharacterized protein n=1 Tax=Leptosia nina TaxID=320188 RepID=A0AAV1IX96_9NEOP